MTRVAHQTDDRFVLVSVWTKDRQFPETWTRALRENARCRLLDTRMIGDHLYLLFEDPERTPPGPERPDQHGLVDEFVGLLRRALARLDDTKKGWEK